jgi:hypothetical protein
VRRWTCLACLPAALVFASCIPQDVNLIARPSDPVVLTGADLPRVTGVAPNELVAFAYHRFDGGWEQVPVQVDERHRADLQDVHAGITQYSFEAVVYSDAGTLTGPDPNPTIDANDEIVFMARDAGGRVRDSGVAPPAGTVAGSGVELHVADSRAGSNQAWLYLFRHDGSLRGDAGVDYVDYEFDLLAGDYPDDYDFDGRGNAVGDPPLNPAPNANPEHSTVRTAYYTEHFVDRWITDELHITAPGASGVDILDRNRNHATDGFCVRTEQTFAAGHGAFVANIDGPVRAIRDYIGANSSAYSQRTHLFYEQRQDIVTQLRVHPLPEQGPDDFLDLAPAAAGMTYRNNVAPGGVVVDGRPDTVARGPLTWELYEGAQGSLAIAHRIDTDIPDLVVSSFYADDTTPSPLPCTGADRQWWGAAGPTIEQPMPRTDPTPRGGTGPLFHLTATRWHLYAAPGLSAADAERFAADATTPFTVDWVHPWQPPA